jgi:hypothetical protein
MQKPLLKKYYHAHKCYCFELIIHLDQIKKIGFIYSAACAILPRASSVVIIKLSYLCKSPTRIGILNRSRFHKISTLVLLSDNGVDEITLLPIPGLR